MRTSRRSMIKLGLYVAASFVTFCEGLSGRVALAAIPNVPTDAAMNDDGGWLRRDMFEPLVGEYFVVANGSSRVSLRLIAVEDVPSAQHAGTVGSQDCFTLVLRGARSSKLAQLAQDTYRVENGTLGAFSLFLVPGRATASGMTYVATFNRVAL